MPSGRDSFRRNRVAPFVLLYFTTLMTAGVLAGRFLYFLNCGDTYRLVLKFAFYLDVLRRESSSRALRLKNIHSILRP